MADRCSRFPAPETVKLPISDGDWLLVKRRLTAGEQRAAYQRMYVPGLDGALKVNPLEVGLAFMIVYLVDWSLTDDDAQPVPIAGLPDDARARLLNTLDMETFLEIRDAVEQHHAAVTAERAQEKKRPNGPPGDATTSPSPSAPAGASSGSVN